MAPEPEVHATEYDVSCLPHDHPEGFHFTIKVSWRGPGDRWAVTDGFRHCLGADGTWGWEPCPSERDDEWKAANRFDLATALQLAKEQAPLMTCNGWTVEDILAGERK